MAKVKKHIFILISILVSSIIGFSQTGALKGFIYEKESGEPCFFANIFIDGTSYGASSDMNGYFTMQDVPVGEHLITISFVGFNEVKEKIKIEKDKITSKNFYLEKSAFVLNEAIITAEREERRTETRIAIVKVTPTQIKQLPSMGSEPDIAQYLQVLPGVTFTGDQGGQLYIRGGSSVQNLMLLDGMSIFNPFHSIGMFSVFDADIIRNADVYTGGFNAEYGNRISSVIDITTRDGNPNRFSGKMSASTFGTKLLLEGPIIIRNDSLNKPSLTYIFSGKTSYLEHSSRIFYPYINQGKGLPFNYTDLYGKLSLTSSNGSKIHVFGFNFNDNVKYQGISNLGWNSSGVGSNIVMVPSGSTVMIKAKMSYSDYRIGIKALDNLPRESKINGFDFGLDFVYFMGKNQLTWGLNTIGLNTDFRFFNSVGREIKQDNFSTGFSSHIKYKFNLGNLLIEPGFRIQYYSSLSTTSPEPRLNAKYNLSETIRFKFAAGIYSQEIIAANSSRDVVNLFYGFLSGGELSFPSKDISNNDKQIRNVLQKSEHLIAGIELDVIKNIDINIETYIKNFSKISSLNRNKIYSSSDYGKPEHLKTDLAIESGYAYGGDISLKYDKKNLYIWFVYSLGWIKHNDGFEKYTPHYDRRHNINLVTTYKFGDKNSWSLSGRWNLGSGFPFTKTAGFYEEPNMHTNLYHEYWESNGKLGIIYDELNAGRLPYYHRFDLTLNKTIEFNKHSKLELNFSLTNIYNRKNIFYFDRIDYNRVNQLPIMPSIGLNFTF